jgi:hypothetical protein
MKVLLEKNEFEKNRKGFTRCSSTCVDRSCAHVAGCVFAYYNVATDRKDETMSGAPMRDDGEDELFVVVVVVDY